MNVYSIDIKVCATAYIRAEDEKAAKKLLRELKGSALEMPEGSAGDVEISGRQLSDPDRPDVSLSPAMTIHAPWRGSHLEFCEEIADVEGEEEVEDVIG